MRLEVFEAGIRGRLSELIHLLLTYTGLSWPLDQVVGDLLTAPSAGIVNLICKRRIRRELCHRTKFRTASTFYTAV